MEEQEAGAVGEVRGIIYRVRTFDEELRDLRSSVGRHCEVVDECVPEICVDTRGGRNIVRIEQTRWCEDDRKER